MPTSLPYARFVQLIKAIDELPIPADLVNRYRLQYDYILGRVCESSVKGCVLTVANLSSCAILGSQPTVNKRLQELISFGLICSNEGDDRRQRVLTVTEVGQQYLAACSEAMAKAINYNSSID